MEYLTTTIELTRAIQSLYTTHIVQSRMYILILNGLNGLNILQVMQKHRIADRLKALPCIDTVTGCRIPFTNMKAGLDGPIGRKLFLL